MVAVDKADFALALPDVKERVNLYFDQEPKFKKQIQRCATVHNNLMVLDLSNEEIIYPCPQPLFHQERGARTRLSSLPICLWLAVGAKAIDRKLAV
jgi:hypothetical protein